MAKQAGIARSLRLLYTLGMHRCLFVNALVDFSKVRSPERLVPRTSADFGRFLVYGRRSEAPWTRCHGTRISLKIVKTRGAWQAARRLDRPPGVQLSRTDLDQWPSVDVKLIKLAELS